MMVDPAIDEDSLRTLGTDWNANLIRWQLVRRGTPGARSGLTDYRRWLEDQLRRLDAALPLCEQLGVRVVLDLHSPPGGRVTEGGYVGSDDRLFTSPAVQAMFVDVWRGLARRYEGVPAIWGFDLVNEPIEERIAPDCDPWQALSERAARAIREIDPIRTIIVQPPGWAAPDGFTTFEPIDLDNVVYSVHMYQPDKFTHQGLRGNPTPVEYPGEILGHRWDKAALEAALQPVVDFQRRHGVHVFVGEFSAIRWAPAGSAYRYLRDAIKIFEHHDWDWTYHAFREWNGWSVEHGADRDSAAPASETTDRERLLRSWFAHNGKR